MASDESEENEAVRAYFPSFAAHSSACQTKLTTMQLAIISTTKSFFLPFCAHSHDGAYHTNNQLSNEKDPLMPESIWNVQKCYSASVQASLR